MRERVYEEGKREKKYISLFLSRFIKLLPPIMQLL